METALAITRPHDTADDIIIRECAMMGEIKRTREENARLKAEIEAHEARRKPSARRAWRGTGGRSRLRSSRICAGWRRLAWA